MRPNDVDWSKIIDVHPRGEDALYLLWDRIDMVPNYHLKIKAKTSLCAQMVPQNGEQLVLLPP
eukprot:11573252-Karenia_brevis.AAC.1